MDTTTFHDLYTAHARDVFGLARYLTGNDDAATDIVSETFLRAWAGRGVIRAATAKAYLLAIARNLARDFHRTGARRSDAPLPERPVAPNAEATLSLQRLMEAIDALPERYREPLTLAVAGLGYEDIGRVLGIEPGTAKVRVHRARLMLAAATGENRRNNR